MLSKNQNLIANVVRRLVVAAPTIHVFGWRKILLKSGQMGKYAFKKGVSEEKADGNEAGNRRTC